jgi:isocitrate dehydrogenase
MATLFAWTGALRKRGEIDGNDALVSFAGALEAASIKTIEDGVMTGDLYLLSETDNKQKVSTETFIREIKQRLAL